MKVQRKVQIIVFLNKNMHIKHVRKTDSFSISAYV